MEPQAGGSRLPDFMIIGAAKGGTTALYQYLNRHPSVFLSTPKEPEFFSRDSEYERGLDWYTGLFSAASSDQLCGEASTTYTRWPHWPYVPERIAEAVPRVRLLYIMRNPVDRAYSHYVHHMRTGVTMTFEEALQQSSIYLDCSRYMRQIERFLDHFTEEQFCFLLHEELRSRPDTTLDAVQRFLGLPSTDLLSGGHVTANAASADHYLRHRIMSALGRVPGAEAMTARMPKRVRRRAWAAISGWAPAGRVKETAVPPPMLPETRDRLLEEFVPEIGELSRFLGIDLSRWTVADTEARGP